MTEPEENLSQSREGKYFRELARLGAQLRELEHRKSAALLEVRAEAEQKRMRARFYLLSYFGLALIAANTVVALLIGRTLLDNVLMVCLLLFSTFIGLGFVLHALITVGSRRRSILQQESELKLRELEYKQDETADEMRYWEAQIAREKRTSPPPFEQSSRWEG